MTRAAVFFAALLALSIPAAADTKVIDGCAVQKADNGNYYSKVDATCQFTNDAGGKGGDLPKPEKDKTEKS